MTKKETPGQVSAMLVQAFEKLVHHGDLKVITEDVSPDPWLLWLLYTVLCEKMPQVRAQGITLAASCVEAGGDIHEQVSLQDRLSDEEKRERQLYVLAGDYCSALYYEALAAVNAFDMIALFGCTLQQIYEQKMTSYMNETVSFDTRLAQVRDVRSLLTREILKQVGQEAYEGLFVDYILLSAMLKEESAIHTHAHTPLRLALAQERSLDVQAAVWHETKIAICTRLRTYAHAFPQFMPAIIAMVAICEKELH
ncbi:heptaprenyl diphosphate synthase component 1 [Shouchella lonarensis]|uniref:Heptaprenyl diphosphate synthase n=1 Tax=Shouchella lonarensis TaxID=1464122 RepID=A0A1G6J1T4_9BACI|nr:heptaprenyl diphosphate synthase component 1 [Shouchella lonarensis]SDC12748.1 heptaprenyl diphosphate synthase [Shouchella lonarensis]